MHNLQWQNNAAPGVEPHYLEKSLTLCPDHSSTLQALTVLHKIACHIEMLLLRNWEGSCFCCRRRTADRLGPILLPLCDEKEPHESLHCRAANMSRHHASQVPP